MLVKIGFLNKVVKEYLLDDNATLKDILIANNLDCDDILEDFDIDIVRKDGTHLDEHEAGDVVLADKYDLENGCAVIIKDTDLRDAKYNEGWYSATIDGDMDFLWYDEDSEIFCNARNDEAYKESQLKDIELA